MRCHAHLTRISLPSRHTVTSFAAATSSYSMRPKRRSISFAVVRRESLAISRRNSRSSPSVSIGSPFKREGEGRIESTFAGVLIFVFVGDERNVHPIILSFKSHGAKSAKAASVGTSTLYGCTRSPVPTIESVRANSARGPRRPVRGVNRQR